jgi:hypothetical protein
MTLTELREFSNLKLASESEITAAEHREVNNAILDFIQTMLPLATGTFSIGDVTSQDNIRTVTFPDVGTDNYRVFGGLKYVGTDWNISNDVMCMTGDYTRTSFKIALREIASNAQNLNFEWEIKAKN